MPGRLVSVHTTSARARIWSARAVCENSAFSSICATPRLAVPAVNGLGSPMADRVPAGSAVCGAVDEGLQRAAHRQRDR